MLALLTQAVEQVVEQETKALVLYSLEPLVVQVL
jgi:hypothetical protein